MDSSLHYDSAPVAPVVVSQPQRHKYMSRFKLELKLKTVLQKLAMGVSHIAAMLNNAFYPQPTRVPTDAQFQTAQDELQAANDAADLLESQWKAANILRDQKEAIWDTLLTARAANCEAVTPNDLTKLATVGLPLRTAAVAVGDLPAPSDLRATIGSHLGEIDLQWDPVYGASIYELECMEHGVAGQSWQAVKSVTQSKYTVTGLVSGKQYAFRVRALGPKGAGPWSDEAVKMAA